MLIYKFPAIYEFFFNLPPFLLWRRKGLKLFSNELSSLDFMPLKILEVGCGTGFLTPLLKKQFPDAELLGIDISSQMINIARAKYGSFAEFKVSDFLQYKEKCDLIVSINTFYFFTLSQIIEKIKALVNPHGACIIITYTRAPFSILHQLFTAIFLKTIVRTYSPAQFYTAFKSTNFSLHSKIISEIEGTYLLKIKNAHGFHGCSPR